MPGPDDIYALILKLTGMSYDTNVLVFDKEGNKIKEENLSKKINATGLNLSQFLLNDGQDNFYFVNIVVVTIITIIIIVYIQKKKDVLHTK